MADFYIRSWDPASTYPPDPQEGDVCYTITLDQSWSPVAGVKNDNLLKEEVYENGEWKEVGGGGGGGGAAEIIGVLVNNNNWTVTEEDYDKLSSAISEATMGKGAFPLLAHYRSAMVGGSEFYHYVGDWIAPDYSNGGYVFTTGQQSVVVRRYDYNVYEVGSGMLHSYERPLGGMPSSHEVYFNDAGTMKKYNAYAVAVCCYGQEIYYAPLGLGNLYAKSIQQKKFSIPTSAQIAALTSGDAYYSLSISENGVCFIMTLSDDSEVLLLDPRYVRNIKYKA